MYQLYVHRFSCNIFTLDCHAERQLNSYDDNKEVIITRQNTFSTYKLHYTALFNSQVENEL